MWFQPARPEQFPSSKPIRFLIMYCSTTMQNTPIRKCFWHILTLHKLIFTHFTSNDKKLPEYRYNNQQLFLEKQYLCQMYLLIKRLNFIENKIPFSMKLAFKRVTCKSQKELFPYLNNCVFFTVIDKVLVHLVFLAIYNTEVKRFCSYSGEEYQLNSESSSPP